MAWTAADRRTYAPALQEMGRRGMIVRLAQTMAALDPQPKVGRQRVWAALSMLQALSVALGPRRLRLVARAACRRPSRRRRA